MVAQSRLKLRQRIHMEESKQLPNKQDNNFSRTVCCFTLNSTERFDILHSAKLACSRYVCYPLR